MDEPNPRFRFPMRRRALIGAAGIAAVAAAPAGWTARSDLESVPLDVAATDERYALQVGEVVRKDRYGTWRAPRFAPDGVIGAVEPQVSEPEKLELPADQRQRSAAVVLATAIASLLDSLLALEETNERYAEVSPEIVASLALEGIDPHAFDAVFESMPLTFVVGRQGGAPEEFDVEPAPYDEQGTRIHVLEHAVRIGPSRSAVLAKGDSVIATVRGTIPVVRGEDEDWLLRDITLALGVGHGGDTIVVAYAGRAGVAVHVADPQAIPAVEAAAQTPDGWADQYVGDLTVALPAEFPNVPAMDTGLLLGEAGAGSGASPSRGTGSGRPRRTPSAAGRRSPASMCPARP